jgi:hypothetical protein
LLSNRRGGSGDNYNNTIFDDEAATPISQGRAPFSGSFRPEVALSGFDGKNARGTWQLIVEDRASRDTGRLVSWSVTIEGSAGALARARSVDAVFAETPETGRMPETIPARELSADALRVLCQTQSRTEVLPFSGQLQAGDDSFLSATSSSPTLDSPPLADSTTSDNHFDGFAFSHSSAPSLDQLMSFFSLEDELNPF